jgi:hypothetical protein
MSTMRFPHPQPISSRWSGSDWLQPLVTAIMSDAILFRLGKAIDLAFLMSEDKRDMKGSSKIRRFLSAVEVSSQANSLSSCE